MPNQVTLTLGEIARIALGTEFLGPINIALLHGLIDILLKKLDCHDTKVKIGGYESNLLNKMLPNSNARPFVFLEDNIEMIVMKFKRINEVERHLEKIEQRINKHFEEIEESKRHNIGGIYDFQNWEHHAGYNEDVCVKCEPFNIQACDLMKNIDFIQKLFRRVVFPYVNSFHKFEESIKKLHEDFTKFMEITNEHYFKVALLERCSDEIDNVIRQFENNRSEFLNVMEEVQDMLDRKLDKGIISILKKYVHDRYISIEHQVNTIKASSLSTEGGLIMDGIRCLSCGNEKVCIEKTVHTRSDFPVARTRVKLKPISKKYGICQSEKPSVTKIHLPSNNVQIINLNTTNVQPKTCNNDKFILKRATNKVFYRMSLKEISNDDEDLIFGNEYLKDNTPSKIYISTA